MCALTPESEDINRDPKEIAACAWLPIEEYVDSTIATEKERGVPDTMNSFFMRSVLSTYKQGFLPSSLGWLETELPTAAGLQTKAQITGLTSKNNYRMYHPPAFTKESGTW